MPFLRRRGNMVANEVDVRHHHAKVSAPPASQDRDTPNLPKSSQQSFDETDALSQQESRDSATSRPRTPLVQLPSSKHRRFSVLRFRNASDSQLSLRVKQQAEKPPPPPIPRPPAIITTAPTTELNQVPKKMSSRMGLAARFRRSADGPRDEQQLLQQQQPSPPRLHPSQLLPPLPSSPPPLSYIQPHQQHTQSHHIHYQLLPPQELHDTHVLPEEPSRRSFADDVGRPSFNTLDEPHSPRPSTQATIASNCTGLGISANRPSESSRSDVSSTDRVSQCSPNGTSKKSRPTTPFFKLRRARKPPEPLFPLAHLQQNSNMAAIGSASSLAVEGTPRPASAQSAGTPRGQNGYGDHDPHASPAAALFVSSNGGLSGCSSPSPSPTQNNHLRGRSSTMSSLGRGSTDDHLGAPRTRGSSIGRKSFGDLLGLSRLRQASDLGRQGVLTPATPGSIASKSGSLQLPRDSIVLPERIHDESPAKYLARLEGVFSRGVIAAALSKGTDAFSVAALRSFMRTFSFFGDPMDMAIRKLLMEAELPKETQQIDRFLQAFANRYHECNPGIYSSPDQADYVAFSLMILHTDAFNRSNKHKMQKADYIKNTRHGPHGEGIFDEILECFFDNICYTPFIHVEDDVEPGSERTGTNKLRRKNLLSPSSGESPRRATREPIDPYALILEGNLDTLRPNLKDAMHLQDSYSYLGSAQALNLKDLQKTFFRTGVLQIVSARSRPDAFMSDKTGSNPDDTHPGIVDIKVTKVGLLWRKDAKKRKTRSPWQEWGAILTGAQLYFFRNTSWVKSLMHQYESHIKAGHDGIPLTFKPPLEEFKPDALISTDGAVALLDTSYKKHKNAFIYIRQGGLDEVLLADDEHELNDWLAKLNYAAAFRTSGVRMRGVVGGTYDGQSRRGFRRLGSSDASQLIQTPTGPVTVARSRIDHKMAEDIQIARRDVMRQKIAEADGKMEESRKALEDHLRNARHLQILAPIQPRTREQLLSAAARMSAQLKWTRMEIWREKCHRDILALDLEEEEMEGQTASSKQGGETRTKLLAADYGEAVMDAMERRLSVAARGDSRTNPERNLEMNFRRGTNSRISSISIPLESSHDAYRASTSPTRPSSAPRPQRHSHDLTGRLDRLEKLERLEKVERKVDLESTRHGSISSNAASSMLPSPTLKLGQAGWEATAAEDDRDKKKADDVSPDVDAGERLFLKQIGLVQVRTGRDPTDKLTTSTSVEALDQLLPGERDKFERSKIRRSLQRTLRESAGHLSHHRSKKGREGHPAVSSDDTIRDTSTLARGAGSFVVHGKKASVINLGSELHVMSDEQMFRKQPQPHQQQQQQQPTSPVMSQDDAMFCVAETRTDCHAPERRESAASASTATARSFRDLHRKYSSVQTTRSVSAAGRLAIPSDGDSETATSYSDGRRSPLPPMGDEDKTVVDGSRSPLPPMGDEEKTATDDEGGGAVEAADREKGQDTGTRTEVEELREDDAETPSRDSLPAVKA